MNIVIQYTTRKMDAFLDQYTLDTLIIENEQAFLQTEIGEFIKLDDSFLIEVFADGKYHTITYEQALNTYCSDTSEWHLFAGLEARVKRKAVAQMKTVQLTEHELAIIKTALYTHIQQMKREKANGAYVDAEILEQYEQAFEALSFAQ